MKNWTVSYPRKLDANGAPAGDWILQARDEREARSMAASVAQLHGSALLEDGAGLAECFYRLPATRDGDRRG